MKNKYYLTGSTHYVLGSVMGPHPFPMIVRDFQSVISQEAKEQLSNYYQETWKGSNNKLIAEVQCPLFKTA